MGKGIDFEGKKSIITQGAFMAKLVIKDAITVFQKKVKT